MENKPISKKAILEVHKGGKISVSAKRKLRDFNDLSLIYTPGVAVVSGIIAKKKSLKKKYTIAGNTVAIVTDGTAVLGLGDIGPEAALPVMEGKAAIFKEFVALDAFPLCLASKDIGEIVKIVKAVSPVFSGINLEDISAPRCFEIEDELQDLGIPVMHDDQHGTAVVVLAGLMNAAKVVKKPLEKMRVAIVGAGAAGCGIAKLLFGRVKEMIISDSRGIICADRTDLNSAKQGLLKLSNFKNRAGLLSDALKGADAFIGVSAPLLVNRKMIQAMNEDAIVFALSNPTPEIMPEEAERGGAAIIATGRSDFANQINNALVFPGMFRGAIDAGAIKITNKMKLAAAEALAGFIKKPTSKKIIPSIFDANLHQVVAMSVAKAAKR